MVTREEVELRAYRIWQEAGCPDGSSLAHWLQAETEIARTRSQRAGMSC